MARSEAPKPWVIAHRGACGLRPEHTIEAYRLGIEQGADFVEPDLVMSRDGALVARHENELSGTTDVANRPEYAGRRIRRTVDGVERVGWFSEDFTLAELKTLRARERLPELRPASAAYDGQFGIATLDEIVALVREESRARGRPIGIVAELKHAAHFDAIGLSFENALAPILADVGRRDPFFVESFEPGILRRLRERWPVRLVELLQEDARPDLRSIAGYADAIGPAKALIQPPSTLVADAHAAGLLVFAWTFRSENLFLPAGRRGSDDLTAHGDAAGEYRGAYDLGVDAVFSDFPADAVAARA